MSGKWEEYVRRVKPYVPGEQPVVTDNLIKLNTNENPYPPAPGVQKVLQNMDAEKLRLYPNPDAKALVKELSSFYGIDEDRIFTGVGSDDVLGMCFLTFFNSDKPVLFADITYSFYDVWAELFNIPYEKKMLDDNFRLVKEDYLTDNGGIVIANPNAPTGEYVDIDFIEDIVKNNQDSIVIVDEAYIDFGAKSAVGLIDKYENVIIVQTFSKSRSMAGMRIGYCFGSKKVIDALKAVKFSYNSYTMSMATIETGVEALRDRKYFEETTAKIIATRERTKKELKRLGFSFPDSMTNFVFATHNKVPAKEIMSMLRENEIFVRYFNAPRIDNYLRITIGTDEQMDKLISVLDAYLS